MVLQKSMASQIEQPNPMQNPSILTLKCGRNVFYKSNSSNLERETPSPDNNSAGDSPEIKGSLLSKKSRSMGSLMKNLGEDPLIGVSRKESDVEKSASEKKLWSLRTRRSVRMAKKDIRGLIEHPELNSDSAKKEIEIPKLFVSLTQEEIEEDFLAMKGLKPSRRPKKRAKLLQKTLDEKFPGLWLSHITQDSYKVHDQP